MIRKLTLIHLPIVLELENGEKLPYTTLVPMYSYQLENEVIVCDKPELPNYPIITPCKVKQDHIGWVCDRNRYSLSYERVVVETVIFKGAALNAYKS